MNAPLRELNVAPRTRGRAPKVASGELIGELTPADLDLLANTERGIKPQPLKELRERHHNVARMIAMGSRDYEIAMVTGYSLSRLSILKTNPAFQALVEDYKSQNDAAQADFVERATNLSIAVLSKLEDKVEEDETLSPTMLLEIGKFAADRSGNGPASKNVNLNVNVGLGSRMAAARERMRTLRIVDNRVLNESGDSELDSGGRAPS